MSSDVPVFIHLCNLLTCPFLLDIFMLFCSYGAPCEDGDEDDFSDLSDDDVGFASHRRKRYTISL